MTSIREQLSELYQNAFEALGHRAEFGRVVESDKAAPFQCNGAMAATGDAKKRGEKLNPREVAQAVVDAVEGSPLIAAQEIAGPGFINITPSAEALNARANALQADARVGAQMDPAPQTTLIDYGGMNVAKPMHVGHLRSSVIGDALKRMLRFRGHDVIGDIHMGDWGLQMGHLISELAEEQPDLVYFDLEVTDGFPEESPVTIEDLSRLYPQASGRAKADPERMKASRRATAEMQKGRAGYRALLQHFIDVSVAELKKDLGRLGVEFDLWNGEMCVDPLIPGMVEGLLKAGVAEVDDGATIIRVAEESDKAEIPPVILISRTGAALYHTSDMATIVDRLAMDTPPDRMFYVVDQRQAQHFEQVFRASAKAGWLARDRMEHLGFGTMNGPDGKPFKTRAGGILKLSDLMDQATDQARARLKEAGLGAELDADEFEAIARKVAIAALKFSDLSNPRMTNYIFDLERFVAFEGKTGPYLLYACVRIKSLLRRAAERGVSAGEIEVAEPAEAALVLALDDFDRALALTEAKRAPHILCDHVYRVAQAFSKFYSDCPVLADTVSAEVKSSRLALAEMTLRQLEIGLELLGIQVPERM
jgi:arginyl-tRNA synthetase